MRIRLQLPTLHLHDICFYKPPQAIMPQWGLSFPSPHQNFTIYLLPFDSKWCIIEISENTFVQIHMKDRTDDVGMAWQIPDACRPAR